MNDDGTVKQSLKVKYKFLLHQSNNKRVDYSILSTKYKCIRWFPLRLTRFPAGERWGQQDVGHGVVATGRGALRLRSLIASLRGLNCSLFPWDIELTS